MSTHRECLCWQSEQDCSTPEGRSVSEFQTAGRVARPSTQSELDMSGSPSSSAGVPKKHNCYVALISSSSHSSSALVPDKHKCYVALA